MAWPLAPGLRALTLGGVAGTGFEDEPYITFVLEADDAVQAERRAQELAAAMQTDPHPAGPLPVAWVTPMRGTDVDSHRFLEQAKHLFDDERYDLAVVSAHIHLEVQVRTLLERAVDVSGQAWAKRLLKLRPWASLSSDPAKAAIETILGINPTATSEWPEVAAHIARRNGIVHEGHQIEPNEAARSIWAVQAFWTTLADASSS
jgi:hypothetical protein